MPIHLTSVVLLASIAPFATLAYASSPFPSRYGNYFEVTASDGMLIGGEGRTGDSMRYRGENIWSGPGSATLLVREDRNTGVVMGTVRANGHTYTVLMNRFGGERPYQSGGIAKFVTLHGLTRQGAPILPKTYAYLAGWGSPCTVWKDDSLLYDKFDCHFMLTEGVRDPVTGEVPGFPDKRDVRELLRGQRWQGDYERNENTRRRIRDAADVSRMGLQLHVVAHSPERDTGHLPPYETAMHFLWMNVQWWSSPQISGEPPAGRADEDIAHIVRRKLPDDDIQVRVDQGRVTLTGTANSAVEKHHAYFAAWVPGVTSVRNEIRVQGDDTVGDRDLQQAIKRAYGLDPRTTHHRPKVDVTDGIVAITGTVAGAEAKKAAEEIARQFDGVKSVRNRLKVDERIARNESRDADAVVFDIEPIAPETSRHDRELEEDIESELAWSPYVDADQVTVAVRNRTAYLFGTVDDEDEMDAAVDNAFEAGADRVVNGLTIERDPERAG